MSNGMEWGRTIAIPVHFVVRLCWFVSSTQQKRDLVTDAALESVMYVGYASRRGFVTEAGQ